MLFGTEKAGGIIILHVHVLNILSFKFQLDKQFLRTFTKLFYSKSFNYEFMYEYLYLFKGMIENIFLNVGIPFKS